MKLEDLPERWRNKLPENITTENIDFSSHMVFHFEDLTSFFLRNCYVIENKDWKEILALTEHNGYHIIPAESIESVLFIPSVNPEDRLIRDHLREAAILICPICAKGEWPGLDSDLDFMHIHTNTYSTALSGSHCPANSIYDAMLCLNLLQSNLPEVKGS